MAEGRSVEETHIDIEAWRANIRRDALSNHHYCMARAITREGNRAVAIERLRLALEVDGGMTPALAELAVLLRAEGREADAHAAETRAATLSADWQAEAALRRGRELATLAPDEALQELAVAETSPALRREARSEIANIHFARALRHHASGDLDATFAEMRVALSFDDDNPTLLHHISHQFFAAGDLDRAAACAAKATRLTTDTHRAAYLELAANFLRRQNDWDALCALGRDALARNPLLTDARLVLVQSLLAAGRHDEAVRVVRLGQTVAPDQAVLAAAEAIALYDSRQDAAAEALLRRLIVRHPTAQMPRGLLAALLCDGGRAAEALVIAKAAPVQGSPVHAIGLALAQAGTGNPEAGQRLVRDAAAMVLHLLWWPGWVVGRMQRRHAATLAPLHQAAGLLPP